MRGRRSVEGSGGGRSPSSMVLAAWWFWFCVWVAVRGVGEWRDYGPRGSSAEVDTGAGCSGVTVPPVGLFGSPGCLADWRKRCRDVAAQPIVMTTSLNLSEQK
jgi:hypothetical protein